MTKESRTQIARSGGHARIRAHGNPGTPEGRRLGGLNSIATHRAKGTKFKLLQNIRTPHCSAKLAELLGIFMGDGHLGTYQASVVTNSITDMEHALYIKELLEDLFGLPVSTKERKDSNAVIILLSSKKVCDFLSELGMPVGNKLAKGFKIPSWILEKDIYRKALIRGLIDTDGCVYEDRHAGKKRIYISICIAFTSASPELLDFVQSTLQLLGFSVSRSRRDIRIRRREEVLRYAQEVGFSNPKHSRKIAV